jgi:thiol-disulfide isomerase/thioredoxin
MKKSLLFLAAATTLAAYGQNPLLTEHFNDTANALLTNIGWYAHSGGTTNAVSVVSPGLSWAQTAYPGSGVGNAGGVVNTGQDVNKPLSANVDTGAIYTSFLVKADGAVATSYFFHYAEYSNITTPSYSSISTSFRARTFVLPGTDPTTQFKIGLTFNSSSISGDTTANLTIGTTYLVVVKYQFVSGTGNDEVSLWLFEDGDNIASLPTTPTIGPLTGTAADLTAVQAIALRQGAAGQNVIVDGIIADTTFGFAPPAVTHNVTFQVDMNQVTQGFTTPEVNGLWNNWCGNCNAMSDANGDGIWEVTIPLLEGSTQEYKYSADSWTIQEMNDPSASCTNGNATYTNRVLVVPNADTTLPVVCWSSCYGCTSEVTLKVNMAWEVANNAISADGIHVAGDFQGWNPSATEMTDADNDGVYEVTVSIPSNSSIEYKFINGNAWGLDEPVPTSCAVTGTTNRGATFTYSDSAMAAVCFGKCTDCMVGLDETFDNISLFPNPTHDEFNLARANVTKEVEVSVLDLQGKVLTTATWDAGSEAMSINLGHLANGIYLVRMTSIEGSRTLRLSKN